MFRLTDVSFRIRLDLVAECVARTPWGIALSREGMLAGVFWYGLISNIGRIKLERG